MSVNNIKTEEPLFSDQQPTLKYIDIRRGFWCCKRMMVLAKYHDSMDIQDGKISVYAPEDSFWKRHINQDYFKFEFCPYCSKRLFTSQ